MTLRKGLLVLGCIWAVGGGALNARGAEFKALESRVFDGASYEGKTRTLTLYFDSGAIYAFREVPRQVFDDLTRIVNCGEYFNRSIRKQYRFERLDRYPGVWCARE